MLLKKLALAAALALTGSVAFAEDLALEIPLVPDANTPGAWSAGWGVTHTAVGSFTDTFTFTPNVAGTVNGSLITIGYQPNQNIDFVSATINGQAYGFSPTGALEYGWRGPVDLGAPITLTVTGYAGSGLPMSEPIAASYSATLNISAVPEPETYALMLAGLGAVGWVARRRRAR